MKEKELLPNQDSSVDLIDGLVSSEAEGDTLQSALDVASEAKPVDVAASEPNNSLSSAETEHDDLSEEETENNFQTDADAEEIDDSEIYPEDNADALDNWALDDSEDSEERADEIGISGIYDKYGRELLKNVFENRLRLSRNSVKLIYGKLKNEILSYEGVTRRFVGKEEKFFVNLEEIFNFAIDDGALIFSAAGKQIKVELDKKKKNIKSALTAIEKVVSRLGLAKKSEFSPVAYAERYQFNPEAVLRGEKNQEPSEDELEEIEYELIEGELERELIDEMISRLYGEESKMPEEELTQQAVTAQGAAALTEPIVYFYSVGKNSENNLAYVVVQQVLNDKFLGKMLPQQFFAVAESSQRIETLNLMTIKQTAEACNAHPDWLFVTQASARLLVSDNILKELLESVETESKNLVLAFDCSLLEALGDRGLKGIRALAEKDVKIMLDNTENAGLKVLTEYNIDYLRFDARYYKEEDVKKSAHLDMLLGYAKVQGIKTSALYVNTVKECRYLLSKGIENIEGDVVGNPVRIAANAVKQAKRLPTN